MNDSYEILDNITESLCALIDAGALPNNTEEPEPHVTELSEGKLLYSLYMSFSVGDCDDLIDLLLDKDDDGQWQLMVVDSDEKEPGDFLLPGLRSYLLQHPSLQYEDFTPRTEMNYYILKNIPDEYCKVATIATAMAVQEYLTTHIENNR